jgi:hypothetical protein
MSRHFRKYVLCNARDGKFGRCTLVAGHGSGRWHAEIRRGRLWASWRGPIPGETCWYYGKRITVHAPRAKLPARAVSGTSSVVPTEGGTTPHQD